MRTKSISTGFFLLLVVLSGLVLRAVRRDMQKRVPAALQGGGFLLPNGWTITPTGNQIPVGNLPLGMVLAENGKYLLVTNNGYGDQSLSIIETDKSEVINTVPVNRSWLGITYCSRKKKIYVSGGGDNKILIYNFAEGKIIPDGQIDLTNYIGLYFKTDEIFPAGIALTPKGDKLYIANNLNHTLAVADTETKKITGIIPVGKYPYKCLVSANEKEVYVSNWADASVSIIDPHAEKPVATIKVGDHPNDLILSPDGKRLFVANANLNTVSIVDTEKRRVIETVSAALYPKAPPGSTPNALGVSADARTLFVANADNNCVAVIDISKFDQSRIKGFIPVGWYPTALAVSGNGKRLYVANGKGIASKPNPSGPNPNIRTTRETEYIGRLLIGTVSVIDVPDAQNLDEYTRQVFANSPYRDKLLHGAIPAPAHNPIPDRAGRPSPIKYVVYVIKENRTYDQVLGDMREGNGDPRLVLFGEKVTPNHHALAREFVLLDNFYVDAEVSADGHNWSTAAYATDYIEKMWPTVYSHRGRTYDFEGGNKLTTPSQGYIWDLCARFNVSFRSYGEFIQNGSTPGQPGKARLPSLNGHFDPWYRSFDLSYSDMERLKEWTREFRNFEANGNLPRFQIVRLPSDHTSGTTPRAWTPQSMVADNDLALGTLVELISHSKYWKETAIFVLEDDAQNGPDHVDAHRSIAFVISPYTKRKFLDSTMYCTCSILRTMELILGLPPMSQYDAAAVPLYNSLTSRVDLTPYKARPAQVSLEERNQETAYKAQRSLELALENEDEAPDVEFNEIIWKAVRGEGVEMPPPVRSAFAHERSKQKND